MSFAEVVLFLEGLNLRNRESWEQTRILSYIIAQVNSTKQLKQEDILRFPWDTETDKRDTHVSDEEIKRLRAKAKDIEQQLNNKQNG